MRVCLRTWSETTGGAPLLALFEKWLAEQPTLSNPALFALLTPNSDRRLSAQSALDDLQRDKFVLAIFEPRFSGIIGLHVGEHFRVFHKLSSVA